LTNTITNRQLFFILAVTLTCYSVVVISKEMAEKAGTGAWLTILATSLVFALAAGVIVSLNNMFQGQMLFDYAPTLVTKPVTYMLSIYYVLYFMFILVFLITGFSKLLRADFFPKSPLWSFPLLGLPVFCYIAHKGVTNVARLAEIIGAAFLVTGTFVHIVMATEGEVNRILPLFNPQKIGRYIEGFKSSIFPFLGIEVLLAFPLAQKKGKKPVRTAILALMTVALFYILIVETSIMKLGLNDIVHYKDALIVAIRDTAPAFMEIIARLDILYLTVGFAGLFVGISIVMTAITEYLHRMLPKLSRLAVVIALGVVTYALFLLVSGIKRYEAFSTTLGTYLGLFGAIVIPLVLFIIAKAKKNNQKGGKNAG
jgi:spore germination protein